MRRAILVSLATLVVLSPAASAGLFPSGAWTFRVAGLVVEADENAGLFLLPGGFGWMVFAEDATYSCTHTAGGDTVGYSPSTGTGLVAVELPGECREEERDGRLHLTWRDASFLLQAEGTFT